MKSLNDCVEATELSDSELSRVSGGIIGIDDIIEAAVAWLIVEVIKEGLDYAVNQTGEPSNPAYMNSGNYLQMGGYNSYGGYSN